MKKFAEDALNYVNTYSKPSELKITDMRFAHVESSSVHCILLKLYTNQGLVGMGEIRDGASATYAAMLKSRILGESPCDVDYIFRKIRQFAGPSPSGSWRAKLTNTRFTGCWAGNFEIAFGCIATTEGRPRKKEWTVRLKAWL